MSGWQDDFWFPHTVTVEDTRGSSGMGQSWGPPRELRAEIKDEQRLVRTATGEQSVSSSTVTVPLDSDVTAGSLVTVWPGTVHERQSRVIAVERADNDPDLGSHLVLSLE
jgi:hypothetical protein